MGGQEKRGEEAKILKRGQAGSRGRCLKKEGLEPPYKLCLGGLHSGFGLMIAV